MVKTIKYILFTLLMSLVLLVFRFPYFAVEQRVVSEFSNLFSFAKVDIGAIKYKFPWSFRIEEMRVFRQNSPEKNFVINNVVITPSLKNPVKIFNITAEIFSGDLNTILVLQGDHNTFGLQEISLSGVSCEMIAPLIDWEGRFNGTAQFTGEADGTIGSAGSVLHMMGELTIINGFYRPQTPILEKEQIDFTRITLSLNSSGDAITIERGLFENDVLKSGFNGSMTLSNPWPLWLVDVVGEIEPKKNLFSEDRELDQIFRRMQKIHKESNISYSIIGTAKSANLRIGRNR